MADVFSKKKRSEVMSLIRSKNTKPEIALRKLVSAYFYPKGYRYRIHYKKLIGSPDIVFVAKKLAIFVDGTFWHGYESEKYKRPKDKFWSQKIKANVVRDKKVNKLLKKRGWTVLRIWEHDLEKRPEKILTRIITKFDREK
jgi:DNA mismatch endonuclease (patch repair protein)